MGTDEAIYTQYQCIILPPSAEGYQAKLQRYIEIPSFGAAITAGCKDVEAAARWLDTQFIWDNMITGYNGAKEEFWFYNADNMVELRPMSDGTRTVPGQSSMMFCSGDEYFAKVVMASHRIEKTEYCKAYEEAGVIEKNSWNILSRLVTLNVEEATEKDLLFAEIHKYANESLSNFIVKGVTDESWNTYMETLNNLRLDDYIALYQTAYGRYAAANQYSAGQILKQSSQSAPCSCPEQGADCVLEDLRERKNSWEHGLYLLPRRKAQVPFHEL